MGRRALLIGTTLCAVIASAQPGAEPRAATAGEQAFTLKLHAAAHAALAGVLDLDWEVTREDAIAADAAAPDDPEPRPLGVAHALALKLKAKSHRADVLKKKYLDFMETVTSKVEIPGAWYQGQVLDEEQSPVVRIEFNDAAAQMAVFADKGATWSAASVPGAVRALRVSHVRALAGGDDGASRDVTALFLGAWGEPSLAGDTLTVAAAPKAGAGPLAVQNVFIRIEAPAALADELITHIDLAALSALIAP